ncbi:hypothetical protein [Rhodopirellula sallentina]|uniref:Uncharacterized protein n=1 Tax=Rhodopirellula sallentina SM41 TaxID=1263870 RepID=M5U4S4_9BACT|nr:hypothetical protein [Rhodopirellula sallentina]EMI56254.1 hypothetical protein RSSM_02304 [Rhodopirellula sallentina SM41]
MAVRLNVLILRPTGAGSAWHGHCDDLIGHVLGRPGLDVTLLERLPVAGEESTEMLALESIGGHAACLAWDAPEKVLADLDRAGRPMLRRPHADDPDASSAGASAGASDRPLSNGDRAPGRMYFFDMREKPSATAVLDSLVKLLKTLQVPTFQIAGGAMGLAKPEASSPTPNTSEPSPVSIQEPDSKPVDAPPAKSSPLPASKPVARDSSQESGDALDRLVDQLDELDI